MFSSTTTELSIRRENASARPPRTMLLMEPPPSDSAMKAARAESGNGEEDRYRRAHAAQENQNHDGGEQQPDSALVQQCLDGCLHEQRLIEHHAGDQFLGNVEQVRAAASLMPSTTAMVLVSPPCFRTGT